MLPRFLPLLLIGTLAGCASYTEDYQQRLVRSLPNQREVTFDNARSYPGRILCGRYTTLTTDGFSMRTSEFVVGETMMLTSPSKVEVAVYCSKDPQQALYDRLGIGAEDGNWIHLGKLRDDMLAIDSAITRYYDSASTLPEVLENLLQGDYGVSQANLTDPWGRGYHYEGGLSGRTAPQFELGSLGADGATGGQGADADISKEQVAMLDHVLRVLGKP
ncbi:MAG: type II secretion system protein GspG [Congregibacter sp.]|nr:type II secretion system protein GspG [Congregibacter sp.]